MKRLLDSSKSGLVTEVRNDILTFIVIKDGCSARVCPGFTSLQSFITWAIKKKVCYQWRQWQTTRNVCMLNIEILDQN